MSEKVSTISARLSEKEMRLLEQMQEELGLSKTDVLQMALETLSASRSSTRAARLEIPVSAETLRRARRLHEQYGLKASLEVLLSEAVEIGVRELRRKLEEDRKGDLQLARDDMDAKVVEMEQDSMTG